MSYFGTDGIRGRFGVFPITPDFILKLGFVTGQVLKEEREKIAKGGHNSHKTAALMNKRPSVVIGKDTRLSGYVIEAALQAGFNAAGVDVNITGPLPTPAIAHLTRSFHADAGVVISASHNPYYDNGIKFFAADGRKLSDSMQESINKKLDAILQDTAPPMMPIDDPDKLGRSLRIEDAKGRYIEFCKGSFPYQYDLSALTIVIDCANGAGYSVGPRVLTELGANVIAIHNQPNGTNINDACGSTHPQSLQQAVIEHGADVGIALDGDGDRIVMVDSKGQLVDGDAILYVLATKADTRVAGVVGTQMSNMGLQLALHEAGIPLERAKVGDRYVMQGLEVQGWLLGGEPSGHILCLDKSRTGDALIAGLQVLAIMAQTQKALNELTNGFTALPQTLVNVRLKKMQDPYSFPSLVEAFNEAEKAISGRGRLLIRKSGTEPLIRIMVELDNAEESQYIAEQLALEVEKVMG